MFTVVKPRLCRGLTLYSNCLMWKKCLILRHQNCNSLPRFLHIVTIISGQIIIDIPHEFSPSGGRAPSRNTNGYTRQNTVCFKNDSIKSNPTDALKTLNEHLPLDDFLNYPEFDYRRDMVA